MKKTPLELEAQKKKDSAPSKAIKTGFYKEWAAKVALFCDILGMDDNELTKSNMEAIRCHGRDHKEKRMVRRVWYRDTEWRDEGYYLEFWEVSGYTEGIICAVGPFETDLDSLRAYNTVVSHYKFSKDLLIDDPDDDDDDLDWGDEEELDWGEDEVELDWDIEEDDLDWGEDDDDDDGWQ